MQRSLPKAVRGGRVGEEPCEKMTALMQRSRPVFVPGCHVGAVLDEEPCEIEMTARGRQMQRGLPDIVLGVRVGAVLDEELCEIEKTA